MNVEEYIAQFPEDRKEALAQIREMLQRSFPELEETMQYKMPTYGKDGEVLFAMASQKHHLSFYACHYDLLDAHHDIREKYDCGKSCIRFRKFDKEVLEDLRLISKHIYANVELSDSFGKYRMK